MLNDAALENTKICLEEAGDGDKGGAFLASGMRAAEQDSRAALAPTLKLAREFAAAAAAKDANALAVAIAEMHVFGVSSLFGVGDTPDKKNSEWSIVGVAQGGVALPDRDYYLSADPDRVALRAKYVAHVAKMLTLVGGEYEDAAVAEVRSITLVPIRPRRRGERRSLRTFPGVSLRSSHRFQRPPSTPFNSN